MEVNDYVIQYPIDAVHTVKFAELLGKPETAVVKMVKENKLPVLSFVIQVSRTLVSVRSGFSFQSLIALYERRFITDQLNSVMHGFCGWGCDYE